MSPYLMLEDTPSESAPEELEITWREAKDKLQIDAIYFIANAPIIYFKRFEAFDERIIADFHRKVWNQSQIPLIFAILPNDIRVYNGYETPKNSQVTTVIEPTRLDQELTNSINIWERLAIFSRLAIDSGSFWRDYGNYFRRETRADQMLIANLRYVRRQLIAEAHLNPEHAHSLIGRSIFAFYLQDRGVLSEGDEGFFAKTFGKSYLRYTDLLVSHEDTYRFFDFLREHFNGDMFPVTEEEKVAVTSEHLERLQRLFTVDVIRGGQMLFFWAYNFEFIPIELISAIYEEFLYQEESGKDGAYYTPPMLVDFMLDQILPWHSLNYKLRVLDPACGSGIFLVEAYRRLIERWRQSHEYQKPSFPELSDILTTSVFGVDIKRQALRVAAFSLYLALLDYLEPKTIWMDVIFPPLIGSNLIQSDFLDEGIQVHIALRSFDIVIGNPPWESQLTSYAQEFLTQYKYIVGDKQIAQAFLRRAPQFCKLQGQIALLCSSKSLLYNKSGPNLAFRKAFFSDFTVEKVFDFSAMRHFLFEKGDAPATAIFYTHEKPSLQSTVFYGAPKLTHLTRRLAAIIIEANDLKQIPTWQILASLDNPGKRDLRLVTQKTLFSEDDESSEGIFKHYINIWKSALWGTHHDYTLLQELNAYPTLEEVEDYLGWFGPHGGFNRTGPGESKYFPWLDKALFLQAEDFTQYGINKDLLQTLPQGALYYRGADPRLFKAPFVMFKRGQVQRRPGAAFSDVDFTYTTSISGIAGPVRDSNLLKALTALLNSDFAQYFWFLTSSSWGVEREEVTVGELKTLPFPFLKAPSFMVNHIAHLVDQLAEITRDCSKYRLESPFDSSGFIDELDQKAKLLERELNHNVCECFQLSDQEILMVNETVESTISFFNSPEKSMSLQRPTVNIQTSYAEAYIESINFYLEPVGRKLTATVYIDEVLPMLGVRFTSRKLHEEDPSVQISFPDTYMRRTLPNLYRLSFERLSRGLYHRRNFRVYDKPESFSIFKPAERRLWTISAALSDADETIAELLQSKKALK